MAVGRKKRSSPKKVAIVYNDGQNRVEYVAKPPSGLRPELERVQFNILQAIRMLNTMRRIRHIVLRTASFQLSHSIRELPKDAGDQEVADEIARLSFLMEDTLLILRRLTHCRIANLEETRFKLQYGQTPKKRDPPARYGAKSRRNSSDKEEEE